MDQKITEHQELLSKRIFFFNYIEVFFKCCIVLDETTFHSQNKHRQERMLSF